MRLALGSVLCPVTSFSLGKGSFSIPWHAQRTPVRTQIHRYPSPRVEPLMLMQLSCILPCMGTYLCYL